MGQFGLGLLCHGAILVFAAGLSASFAFEDHDLTSAGMPLFRTKQREGGAACGFAYAQDTVCLRNYVLANFVSCVLYTTDVV